jgi:dsRNA-specific ribonuclease
MVNILSTFHNQQLIDLPTNIVKGQEYGRGEGPNKDVAGEIAAQAAYQALLVERANRQV